MGLVERLVYRRQNWFARQALLALFHVEVHARTTVGPHLLLQHRGHGVVITPRTRIGAGVTIFHDVTIGRQAIDGEDADVGFEGIEIGDQAVLCAGARVLGGQGVTRVGAGTIVGAGAVLTKSTGEWEVWSGIPARKVADRPRSRHAWPRVNSLH
jgi:serine acetyltransferase